MEQLTHYFKYQKVVVYAMFTLMATQFIYFYQDYGYIHVILYLLFLLSLDVFKPEYRNQKYEISLSILFAISTLVLIGANTNGESELVYNLIIFILSISMIPIVIRFKTVFKNKELEKINERNIKMFERKDQFLLIYSYIVIITLIGISAMSIQSMFTLI